MTKTYAPTQLTVDLKNTYTYLQQHGWCQGSFKENDGRVCLDGALIRAIDPENNYVSFVVGPDREARYLEARKVLNDVLRDHYGVDCLWDFNDEVATSVDDVKDALQLAIDMSEYRLV